MQHQDSTQLHRPMQHVRVGVPVAVTIAGLCNVMSQYQLVHDVGHLLPAISLALPASVELGVYLTTSVWSAATGPFRRRALRYALSAMSISLILVWLDHAITLWNTGWHLAVTEFVTMIPSLIAVLLMFLERDTARALDHVALQVAAAEAVIQDDCRPVPSSVQSVDTAAALIDTPAPAAVQPPAADRQSAKPALQESGRQKSAISPAMERAARELLDDQSQDWTVDQIAARYSKSPRWSAYVRRTLVQLQEASARQCVTT